MNDAVQFVTVGIGSSDPRVHVFMEPKDCLMVSVRGIPPAALEAMSSAELDRDVWPAGSPYIVLDRTRPGRMLRGSVTAGGTFKHLDLLAASRLAGGSTRVDALRRWLIGRAVVLGWPGWREYARTQQDPGFDIIDVSPRTRDDS
jgi:hypothetical protein